MPISGIVRVRLPSLLLPLTCLAACVGAIAAPTALGAAVEYRVVGHGWGHGIGMSQYGAQGLAEQGKSASEIIRHYYTGVTVEATPASARAVDVLLTADVSQAVFQVDGDD